MAIKSQVRLVQLTGSLANISSISTAGEAAGKLVGAGQSQTAPNQNYTLPNAFSLDAVLSLGGQSRNDDLSGVLQFLADGLGKIHGSADWTNSTPGTFQFGNVANSGQPGGNEFDIKLLQDQSSKMIQLDSSGEILIGSDGDLEIGSNSSNATILQTGGDIRGPGTHAQGIGAGGISVLSQQLLLLSSSKGIRLETAPGGQNILINSQAGDKRVEIRSAGSGPGALILSASNFGGDGTIRAQTSRLEWLSDGNAADGANKADWALTMQGASVAFGAWKSATNAKVFAGSGGGQLLLSGSGNNAPIGFSCGDADGTNKYPNSQGPGAIALYDGLSEAADFVDNFAQNKTILGAINQLKTAAAADTVPTLFVKQIEQAGVPGGDDVVVAKLPEGSGANANMDKHEPERVQVMLNGQLLISASGGDASSFADGDYIIKGDGTTDALRFGFNLVADDQVRVWYFGSNT